MRPLPTLFDPSLEAFGGQRPAEVRKSNRAKALGLLREHPRGRAELARALGLSKPALGDLVAGLIQEQWVMEDSPTPIQRGRYPAPLRLNPERFRVLGLHLTVDTIEAGLYNPLGQDLQTLRAPSGVGEGSEAVYGRLLALAKKVLKRAKVPVVAVGIATPGPINFELGQVLTPPHFPDLHQMRLVERIGHDLGLPTYLEHDSAAAARQYLSHSAAENFIYILLNRGIGAGIVIGREVYRGHHGFAGELGHFSLDIDGEPCPCGSSGCLETVAGTAAIASRYYKLSQLSLPLPQVAERARDGDSVALRAFEHAGRALGWAAVNLVNLFDPQLLVLGGAGAAFADLLTPSLRMYLNSRAYPYLGWGQHLSIEVDRKPQPVGSGAAEYALGAIYRGEIALPIRNKGVEMT